MKCLKCGTEQLNTTTENVPYRSLPGVILGNVTVRTCPRCGERYTAIPSIRKLNRAIGSYLIKQPGRLSPAEVKFLRKSLGWSIDDFAAQMTVHPRTVRRWEKGVTPMTGTAEALLRLHVLHQEPVADYSSQDIALRVDAQVEDRAPLVHFDPQDGWHPRPVA